MITRIEPHDSVERYSKLGVDCIAGHASVTSPWSLEVGGERVTARSMIIASGGRPLVPPIPGLEHIDYLTSDTIWSLRARPERFAVLGGGPIGCELAQAFSRLGSQTTIVEMLPRLLVKEDAEVSAALEARFASENIRVLTGYQATRFEKRGTASFATCERNGETVEIEFDALLIAVGRRANTDGFGLEEAGVRLRPDGTVAVNEYLQTSQPNIYACGDAAGPYQLTHAAAHQAWYCAMNALFGRFKRFKADYSVIPWAVFTDPEIARVGLSEQEARDQGLDFDITRYGIDDLDRAIADGEAHGFVKLLTARGSDRILGATIVGHHAGDLIAEYVSAMRNGLGVRKILNTIHIYPTLVEANRYAAGEWQKARLSPRLLRLAARYHRWVRG